MMAERAGGERSPRRDLRARDDVVMHEAVTDEMRAKPTQSPTSGQSRRAPGVGDEAAPPRKISYWHQHRSDIAQRSRGGQSQRTPSASSSPLRAKRDGIISVASSGRSDRRGCLLPLLRAWATWL